MDPRSEKEKWFDEIYLTYEKEVYVVCLHLAKNEQVAMDLAHQVFLNVYRHLDNIQKDCIRTYLLRTATNLAYNHFRGEKHFVDDEEQVPEASMGTSESPEEQYFNSRRIQQREELCHKILEQMDGKHDRWKKMLDMLYVQGIDSTKVAEEFEINVDALYSQIYRIRKWVYKRYGEEYEKIME